MDEMLAACLVFGLLLRFPGVLNAPEAARPCLAPRLDGGFFLPEQTTYPHQEQITFTCEKGNKTLLDGWWATSTCLDGEWSQQPLCIDENDCSPPVILKGTYKEVASGWYKEGEVIRVRCDPGYEHQHRVATAKCINGTWSSLPVCVRSWDACSQPPQIPHAVIVGEPYRDLFAVDSSIEYECEDGYTLDRQASRKTIFCISGNWTEVPKCIKKVEQAGGDGGKPGTSPGTSSGTSSGSQSGSSQINRYIPIGFCRNRPKISNAVLVERTDSFLRYECRSYFKLDGLDKVFCLDSGLWSRLPVCRPNFCYLDTTMEDQLENSGTFILEMGKSKKLKCLNWGQWYTDHYATARCTPMGLFLTECCSRFGFLGC